MPDAKTGTDVRFGDSWASVLLDLVRGVAAVLVLLSHWKLMFFVDYPKIPGVRWPFAVPYLLCDAGHQAVIIFFVLSGYLISGSVFRMLARRQWSWLTYLIHRLTRLWVVLLPGLALGALLDWVGLFHSRCPGLYNVSDKGHGLYVPAQLTWRAFWGNVFFLQRLGFPDFGSNASLWSLANEFWYYMLFPLGLLAFRREFPWWKRAIWLAMGLGLAWAVRKPLLPLFAVWLAGAALDFLPRVRISNAVRWLAALVYVVSLIFFAKWPLPNLLSDYAFGAVTVGFLWVLLSARGMRATGGAVAPIRGLARFSFSLYVLHMPVLMLLTAMTAGERVWSPKDVRHDGLAMAVLAVVLLCAYLVAFVTEFRTDRVREWVERTLGVSERQRAAVLK